MERFLKVHSYQLQAMGLPEALHRVAGEKILKQIFDAGACFQFQERYTEDDSDEDQVEADTGSVKQEDSKDEDDQSNSETLDMFRTYDLVAVSSLEANSNVFVIDHMWTTTFPQSRRHIRENPSLALRLASMVGFAEVFEEADVNDDVVRRIWDLIWPRLQCYTLPGDEYSKWYLLDEVGSAIGHSISPNVNCCPLLVDCGPGEPPFGVSLLWPSTDIDEGTLITRNYLPFRPQGFERRIRLLGYSDPVSRGDLSYPRELLKSDGAIETPSDSSSGGGTGIDLTAVEPISSEIPACWERILSRLRACAEEANPISIFGTSSKSSAHHHALPLRVYVDRSDHINASMVTDNARLVLVTNPADADVLYLIEHFALESESKQHVLDNELIKTHKMVNQFWWDGLLVTKEMLASTVHTAYKRRGQNAASDCPWYPPSFDLSIEAELIEFLKYYLDRQEELDSSGDANNKNNNIWILKRFRGRQSIDYPITSNLSCILRHLETVPRLASQYILSPALLSGKKFDLRFYILVYSLRPLILRRFCMFIVRCANKGYNLDDLEDYQKHFTLMGMLGDETSGGFGDIRGEGTRSDPPMEEFIKIFNEERGTENLWQSVVQPKIDAVIKEVFFCVHSANAVVGAESNVTALHPNAGWSLNQPNSCPARGMFGIDIMIQETRAPGHPSEFQPKVLEVQWAPDCARALKYNPNFWNEIFGALYLGDRQNIVDI